MCVTDQTLALMRAGVWLRQTKQLVGMIRLLQPHVHDHVNMIINQMYQLCPTNVATVYLVYS